MKVEWTVYEIARLETVSEYLLSFTVISTVCPALLRCVLTRDSQK